MAGHPSGKMKNSLLEALKSKSVQTHFSERCFNKRHILFMPFYEENLIFLVKQGKLRVYMGRDGKEISLALLGPGDVYSTHTRAYVEALEDTTILTCPSATFFSLANRHHELNEALVASLGKIMTGAMTTIENLYFNCIDKRVAVFFHQQAVNVGKQTDEGIYVKVGLTVANIANIVGSSRQTVSTLISSMEKDGILRKIARGEYVIKDMDELGLLANSCAE
jgi:CRP-like cAMP-binding protein